GIAVAFAGQGQTVKDVLAMPGVDGLTVNKNANQTLASIAMDPTQDKIAPTPADASKVGLAFVAGGCTPLSNIGKGISLVTTSVSKPVTRTREAQIEGGSDTAS